MAQVILGIGGLVAFVGSIMILIAAFKTSLAWGFCSLFLPFVILVFTFTHWAEAKKGFLISLAGAVVQGIGYALFMKAAADVMGSMPVVPAAM